MDGWGAADLKTWKVQRTESTQKLIIIFAFAIDEAIWKEVWKQRDVDFLKPQFYMNFELYFVVIRIVLKTAKQI